MSDYSSAEKQTNKEIKINTEDKLDEFMSLPLPKTEGLKSDFDAKKSEEIRNTIGLFGYTNELSGIGKENLNRVLNNEKPLLDNTYIKDTEDFKTTIDKASLSELQREFSEEKYKRKKLFGGYKDDSIDMLAVKESLSIMVDYLSKPIESPNSMENEAVALSYLYKPLILSCNRYLSEEKKKGLHTKVGALRRAMVERILKSASAESELIVSIAKDTQKSVASGDIDVRNMKWEDVLYRCRARHYSKEQGDNISVVGGGTSTVYVVKKDGKDFYFKEKENFDKDALDSKESNAIHNLNAQYAIGKISLEDKDWAETKISEACNCYFTDTNSGIMGNTTAGFIMEAFRYFDTAYNKVKNECIENNKEMTQSMLFEQLVKIINENYKMTIIMKNTKRSKILTFMNNLLGELLQDETKLKAINIGLGSLSKEFVSQSILKKTVKLPDGVSITNNNVATSRLAKLLNMDDTVCQSETVVLNIEGKTKIGNLMEGAKGGYIKDINAGEKPTAYSGKAKKQFLQLSILDYIMGQTDRHYKNFYVTHEKRGDRMVITGVKALDNDACCGLLTPELIEKKRKGNHYSGIRTITDEEKFNLPAIDLEFANSILSLTPEILMFEMADLLKPNQIEAMQKRLLFVQNEIRKVINYREEKMASNPDKYKKLVENQFNIKIIESDEEWEEFGSTAQESDRLVKYNDYMFLPNHTFSTINHNAA